MIKVRILTREELDKLYNEYLLSIKIEDKKQIPIYCTPKSKQLWEQAIKIILQKELNL